MNPIYTALLTDMRRDEVRIRQHSKFERFQQIRNSTNVLSALLSNANSWSISVLQLISYTQRAQTNLL